MASAGWWRPTLRRAALLTPIIMTIEDIVVTVKPVEGESMAPTLQDGDWVLVQKLSTRFSKFERGRVVTLWSPEDPHKLLTKRLIAREGDSLAVPGHREFVLQPRGRCWVEGDNQARSIDSASRFGPVPLALIQGEAVAVVWPLSRAAWLPPRPAGRRVIKTNDPIALAMEK